MPEAQTDTRELRNALGCFATGVTVITTLDEKGWPVGITANSLTSVSLDPPLLLWCLDKRSVTFDVFDACSKFVVSVLGAEAAPLASRFAKKNGHEMEGADTAPTQLGPPTFVGALAVFECDVETRHDGGDHVIVVGRIRRFTHLPDHKHKETDPLLYFRGRYSGLTALSG